MNHLLVWGLGGPAWVLGVEGCGKLHLQGAGLPRDLSLSRAAREAFKAYVLCFKQQTWR